MSDTATPPTSFARRRNQRGNGLVKSTRIEPTSRSYTIESDDCMPLKSWIITASPGVM